MVRVDESDFARPERVARLAHAGGYTPDAFRERFAPLAAKDSRK